MRYLLVLLMLILGQPLFAGDTSWRGPFVELRFGAVASQADLQGSSFGEQTKLSWLSGSGAVDLSGGYRFPIGKTGVYLAPVLRFSGADTVALFEGDFVSPSLPVPANLSLVYREPFALSASLQVSYALSRKWLVYGEYGLVAQAATIRGDFGMGSFHDEATALGVILGYTVTAGFAYCPRGHLCVTAGIERRSYGGQFSNDELSLTYVRGELKPFLGVALKF